MKLRDKGEGKGQRVLAQEGGPCKAHLWEAMIGRRERSEEKRRDNHNEFTKLL